jgi:hypothetical protein
VLGVWNAPQGNQKKDKGKVKAGSGGAGGGPCNKAAAAGSSGQGSSGQGSSGQGSSGPSAPPGRIIGLSTEEPAVQAAEPASGSQPQAAGGGTKAEKERLRKERQRHRKIEEASEALDVAMARMAETGGASSVEAVEEAMQAAAKHEGRSETLAALVAEAKGMVEQARAVEAERAKLAAEEAAAAATVEAAAAAVAAAERLQAEEEVAALTVRLQEAQARLGVPPAAPAPHPHPEEALCVLCLDARMDHIIIPCGHQCVCGPCAEALKRAAHPACPLCREPISVTAKVFLG